MGFIDEQRSQGRAVESICRVLSEQGCQVAARTYRAWKIRQPAARTVTDAQTVDLIRALAWTTDHQRRRRLAPEGCMGGGRWPRWSAAACPRRRRAAWIAGCGYWACPGSAAAGDPHHHPGRLVQHQTAPRHPRNGQPTRVRNHPLRDPEPRAATRIGAARNLGRFNLGTKPSAVNHLANHTRFTRWR